MWSSSINGSIRIPCKIVIMIAMFIGRIGVMTLAVTFAGRPKSQIKYPKENIVIG